MPATEPMDHRQRIVAIERQKAHLRNIRPVPPVVGMLGPCGNEGQHRQVRGGVHHHSQQFVSGRVDPVEILHDQEHRASCRRTFHQVDEHFQQTLALPLRREPERSVHRLVGNRQQRCQQRHRLVRVEPGRQCETVRVSRVSRRRCRSSEKPAARGSCSNHRRQRAAREVRRTRVAKAQRAVVDESARHFVSEPGLANARLARHQQRAAVARLGRLPEASDLLQFGPPIHQRRQVRCTQRVKTALGARFREARTTPAPARRTL